MELRATGVFPANVTAQGTDGQIDLAQTKAVVEFLFSKGVDGLHVCGTTGEFASLSLDQRKAVAEASLEAANGQGTIMVQVGAVSTADSCKLAKHAADIGAHVVSSVPPFYYPASRRSVVNHYQRIAEACGLPVIIYDNPTSTGFTVTHPIARELAEQGKVHGIKLARHDMYSLARMADINDGKFIVYPVETLYLAGLATAPTAGTIGSMSNWIPEAFVGIKRNFEGGDIKRAAWLQRLVCALLEVYMVDEIPATKALLSHRGVLCGQTWEPLLPLTKKQQEKLFNRIDAFQLDYGSLAEVRGGAESTAG
jgi:dihydrodipicolinate synthase/N-acetylneuraminate lyase